MNPVAAISQKTDVACGCSLGTNDPTTRPVRRSVKGIHLIKAEASCASALNAPLPCVKLAPITLINERNTRWHT